MMNRETRKMTFKFYTLSDLIARPSKRWMYKDLIGYNDLVMFYGMPGKGKTFITIDLLVSYVKGNNFSCFAIDEDRPDVRRVIYLTDEGCDSIGDRFKAAVEYHGIDVNRVDNDQLLVALTLPNLYKGGEETNIKALVDSIGEAYGKPIPMCSPDLIVIDTFKNATIGSNENSNDDAAIISHTAKRLKDILGCTVVFVHHSDKGGSLPRGASAFMGDMDMIAKVEAGKMSIEKIKDGEAVDSQAFELVKMGESVAVNWTGQYKQQTNTDKCYEYLHKNPEKEFTAREIAEAIAGPIATTSRDLMAIAKSDSMVHCKLPDDNKRASKVNPYLYLYSDDPFFEFSKNGHS